MKDGPHTLQLEKACIRQWRSSAAINKKVQHFYFLKSWLALFHGASEVVGCFRMKPNISFPPTGRQKVTEVHNEWKHCTFHERLIATEVAADVPVKNGRFLWSESVVGTTNKVSPWSRVSWPMAESTCFWVRGTPATDQGGRERESASLYGVVLWVPIWMFSIWSSLKGGEGYFWTHWYCYASWPGTQRS